MSQRTQNRLINILTGVALVAVMILDYIPGIFSIFAWVFIIAVIVAIPVLYFIVNRSRRKT